MAAVIDFRSATATSDPAGADVAGTPSARPTLSVIEGGRSASARRMRRTFLLRRLLVGAVLLAVIALAVQVVSSVSGGAPVTAGSSTQVHVVQRGDTLWAVAASLDPSADPRDVIDRIVELNSTGGAAAAGFSPDAPLRVGQQLVVPATSS